jgi:hypothetical protein
MNITPEQIKKVWAVARERDVDADTMRNMAEQISGRPSISGLTKDEARRLIDRMEGKESSFASKPLRAANMVTEKQMWKIRKLAQELGWDGNAKRLEGFLLKYTGIAKLEWLSKAKAIGLIDGMKNMLNRKQKEAASH